MTDTQHDLMTPEFAARERALAEPPPRVDPNFAALYAIRDQLAEIDREARDVMAAVDRLRATQRAMPTRADKIMQECRAALDAAASDFESQLFTQLNDPALADLSAVTSGEMAAYLCRGQVASILPRLIRHLCPGADSVVGDSDQQRELGELAEQADRLWQRRDALRQQLAEQQITLRDQRMDAMHRNDWRTRAAIEAQQPTVKDDLAAVREKQDALIKYRSGR